MDDSLIHQGIAAALELTSVANLFVEEQAPWALAKDPTQGPELDATLTSLARALLVLATLFHPILPGKMEDLAGRLGVEGVPTLAGALELDDVPLPGNATPRVDPLLVETPSSPARTCSDGIP